MRLYAIGLGSKTQEMPEEGEDEHREGNMEQSCVKSSGLFPYAAP